MITEFFQKYDKKVFTTGKMRLTIQSHVKDEELRNDLTRLTRKIRKIDGKDSEVFEASIKKFVQTQMVRLSVMHAVEQLNNPSPDFSEVREMLDQAVSLDTKTQDDNYDYFDKPENRIEAEANQKKYPVCIPELDEVLRGGVCAGELLVWVGPPGRGKTLALINCGYAGLVQGLTIYHVTLEISARRVARRYDERACNSDFDTIIKNPDKLKNPLTRLRKKGCNLYIKDFSMEDPSIDDIKASVINLQSRIGRKIDMLIIDYGDLLRPTKNYKEARFGLELVYTQMRRLACQLQVPVITASQATRKSLSKQVITMEDVAESFGKVKVADVVLTICQTPEEEEDNIVRVFVAKSRKKKGHPIVQLTIDSDTCYLGSLGNDDLHNIIRRK